ncbi:MAG TPA: hypothetical protein VFJ88_09905 [Chthoniobacterales bacterium]|jgi:hypothetical protein|nr:hypothetical protein [Chthoniobacterales bacterium]
MLLRAEIAVEPSTRFEKRNAIDEERSGGGNRNYFRGGVMKKTDRLYEVVDPARVALILGLSLGLGIVVHEGFFFLAGAVAVGALAAAIANTIQDHAEGSRLTHQAR